MVIVEDTKKKGDGHVFIHKPAGAGDHIRVKNGTNDPDFERRNLSGYTGVIEDIDDDDLVGILWDKATLSRFSFWFIRKCERRNLDHKRLFLSRDESEVIEPE